jgi:hypothetical protein
MDTLFKYPRTQHLEGSGLQANDDPVTLPFRMLAGQTLTVEEKVDGANCGISFEAPGQLRLQSRGHYLNGGPRERQFELLKSWAARYSAELWELLGTRYRMFGEWLYAKHTVFYTDLPHYFLEYDIYDHETQRFLDTEQRRALLHKAPFIVSVPVLSQQSFSSMPELLALLGPSTMIAADHREQLAAQAEAHGQPIAQILAETDPSGWMEGLYIKVERNGSVLERYKYVRSGFLQTVVDSGSHWMDRPLLPNRLRKGVTLW